MDITFKTIPVKNNTLKFSSRKVSEHKFVSRPSVKFSGLNLLTGKNKALTFKGLILDAKTLLQSSEADKSTSDKSLDARMKSVLSDLKYAGVCADHDGALQTLAQAARDKFISPQKPAILLHFDTHSDIKRNNEPVIHIGNWINTAMESGNVKEIYWVLPEWTKDEKWSDVFWKKDGLWTGQDNAIANVMLDPPAQKNIYRERVSGRLHFDKPFDFETCQNKYSLIKFHKVTVEDLPNLKDKENVVLDICGDYFINSGMSTAAKANNITNFEDNQRDIADSIEKMFTELEKKDIKPSIYTAAESKGFVPEEHMQKVSMNLKKILAYKDSSKKPFSIIV